MALLEIENLSVEFPSHNGVMHAVDGVSLSLDAGEVLGIVGESGSGKSVTMMALMGLVAFPGRVKADTLRFDGHDLLKLSEKERRRLTGKDLSMIFQDPTTSLNPCFTVGFQLAETLKLHLGLDKAQARKRSIELLEQVGIPAPESRLSVYPHQLSGGMSQRVMIAIAIACNPKLLIADEPTTALDVTIQAQILALMSRLQKDTGMSMLFITHNLGVVAHHAERVAVMYAGQVVEQAGVHELFAKPAHPYTQGLLACLPGRARQLARQCGQAVALQDIPGQAPAMNRLGSGCSFAERCSVSLPACQLQAPPWLGNATHARLCHLEGQP